MLISIAIIAVLATVVITRVVHQIEQSKKAEAVNNLGSIRLAELRMYELLGKFVGAEDEAGIESVLGLIVGGGFYDYSIINADEEDFLALATPIGPLSEWLDPMGITKDGFVNLGYGSGSGSSSSSGSGGSGSGGAGGEGSGSDGSGGAGGSGSGGSGGSSGSSYTVGGGGVSISAVAPTDLEVFANSGGWLDFSFTPYSNSYGDIGYIMQMGEMIDGQIQSWDYIGGTSETTASAFAGDLEQGQSGHTYCFRAKTVAEYQGAQYQSDYSEEVCQKAKGTNAVFDAQVDASKADLGQVDPYAFQFPDQAIISGKDEVDFVDSQNTLILYGGTPGNNNAYAYFTWAVSENNSNRAQVIVLDKRFSEAPAEMSSALLAHEALHNIWDKDYRDYQARAESDPNTTPPSYGLPPASWTPPEGWTGPRSSNSLFQEYSAFVAKYQAWYDLRTSIDSASLSSVLKDDYNYWNTDMSQFLTFDALGGLQGVKPFDEDMIIYLETSRGYAGLPDY